MSTRPRYPILALLGALLLAGCSGPVSRQVHLVDGRSFAPPDFLNDGRHIFFALNGWEYTLPVVLVTNQPAVVSQGVIRVLVTTNSISMPGWVFHGFDDLSLYLDTETSAKRPVIVELPDVYQWSEEKQKDFGKLFGSFEKRPYVGLEARWKPE